MYAPRFWHWERNTQRGGDPAGAARTWRIGVPEKSHDKRGWRRARAARLPGKDPPAAVSPLAATQRLTGKDNLSPVEDVIYLDPLFLVKKAVVDDVSRTSNCQTPEPGIHSLLPHPWKLSQHRDRAHDPLDDLFSRLGTVLSYKRENSIEFTMCPAAPSYSHLEALADLMYLERS